MTGFVRVHILSFHPKRCSSLLFAIKEEGYAHNSRDWLCVDIDKGAVEIHQGRNNWRRLAGGFLSYG